MAFFSKPPAKKPDPSKVLARARPASPAMTVVGRVTPARDLAAQATKRGERRNFEPAGGDISLMGSGVAARTPAQLGFEVAESNPGLCAVLENAALCFASGKAADARKLLEEGVAGDAETKTSPHAWLALFDLLQREGDKVAFDRLALQYVVQFERSAPAWESDETPKAVPRTVGGLVALTGRLTAASAPQIESLKRAVARKAQATRLDLNSVYDVEDEGAKLLADAMAEARRARVGLQLQLGSKLVPALDAALERGRGAGEGTWLLALEILQWMDDRAAFEDRAIEFAVAFELSPPSWELPPAPFAIAPAKEIAEQRGQPHDAHEPEFLKWSGVMTGSLAPQLGNLGNSTHGHAVIPIDMSEIERIDFVCAGALLNLITRVETQSKAVQLVGASPIIRALLLLIGVSPRHFVEKAQ